MGLLGEPNLPSSQWYWLLYCLGSVLYLQESVNSLRLDSDDPRLTYQEDSGRDLANITSFLTHSVSSYINSISKNQQIPQQVR